jgi:1,4-dihydroxy-2-naphthoate octaprenyltransferase
LLPFFLFALCISPDFNFYNAFISFFIIHFLFYPSSNGYNSYYDKDEESIGGLKNPPPVSRELLIVSIIFEGLAILAGLLIGWKFSLMIAGIAIVSRAYSHPSVRLKKYPFAGLVTVALFQGAYAFYMSFLGIKGTGFEIFADQRLLYAASLCSLMLFGSYPMTQVYQHGEDGKRGDMTLSRWLGIEGTFIWTGGIFCTTLTGFFIFFYSYFSLTSALLFPVFLLPTLIYFISWYIRVRKNKREANYHSTMKLNAISSLCFIGYFAFFYFTR